jgi:type IV secretion system protein VirB9
MTPALRSAAAWSAGRPAFCNASLAALLISASALAGCAGHIPPPEISYDDAAPAVIAADPPKPVQVVELAKPLPLPGQLKPVGKDNKPEPEAADPTARVDQANAAARMQPVRNGFINAMQLYPFVDGALYQVYASPGQITDISLQPGEQLVGSGPVAAGDTVRWIIGDTESGTGAGKVVHILVKPTRPELMTNLVINTDRRTYHMELRSTPSDLYGLRVLAVSAGPASPCAARTARPRPSSRSRTALISPASTSVTTCRATARRGGRCARSTTAGRCSSSFRAASVRARCRRCSSSAPRATRQGRELPRARQLHDRGRLFAAAELRFGAGKDQARAHLAHRREPAS